MNSYKNFISKSLLVLALLFTGFGFGQITEGFDTGLANFYTTGSQTLSSGVWNMTSVLQEISTNSRTGSNAARINDDVSNAHLTTPAINGGVGTVTFWYRELNTGGGTFALQKSTDGSTYTTITSQSYSGTTYQEFSFDVNDASSNLTIRILSDDNPGHLIIDDFEAMVFTGTTPTISVSESTILNLNYTENNGPSMPQNFTVSGSVLTEPIVLTAPANFEISTSAGSGYGTQVSLPLTSGSVVSTIIYVRLISGLSENSYSGTLAATSTGASQQDVALSGVVSLYCPSSFSEIDADAITNVTLNTLDNDSGDAHVSNSNGYEDFTTLPPTDLQQGQTYNLSVSIDSNGFFLYHIFAFFDWDGDFDFDSPIDESYDLGDNESTSGDLSTHDIDITVPNGANLGNTRMRIVIMSADPSDPDPVACDPQDNDVGETEDYTINIISAISCNLTSLGLSNITCNDNGTPTDPSDDITSFQLNPTGNNLGTTYSVNMDELANISTDIGGPFNSDVLSGFSYNTSTIFYLEPGSAGGGDLVIDVYDDTDNSCLISETITDSGACSFGGGANCGVEIDFETAGGYTTSITEFTDGSRDYFKRTNGSDISSSIEFTNPDGSFFAAQDIDGGGSIPANLIISNIDISNLINLEFSIDLAEDDGDASGNWDDDDFVHIYYTIDGGPEQNLLWVENEDDGTSSNTNPLIDTNFDGEGDGAEITDTFTTFTRAIAETGNQMEIRIEFNLNSDHEDIALDNISVCGIDNSIDSDSQVNEPTAPIPAGTIIAHATTLFSDAVPIFKFEVQDLGTADGFDTVIEQFRIVPGSGNTALWSQVIQGVEVVAEGSGGQVTLSDQNVIVNDTEIIIQILDTPQNEMTTDDADTREYTIGVYLNETGITDQEVIQFAIPSSTTNWLVASGSSQFVSNFTPFEGSLFTIDVVGDGLQFLSNASTTIVGEEMSTVIVVNPDINGNIDRGLTNDVTLTTSAPLENSPVSITPVNGIATFSNLIHNTTGTNFTLTASSPPLSDIVSFSYDIIERPELFITEVTDPIDNFEGRYIEIFNASTEEIDFDTEQFYLVWSRHDDSEIEYIQLSGVIPAKGYYVVGRGFDNQFFDVYNFHPDLPDPNLIGVIAGNGDDTYFLSKDNINDQSLRNSMIDVYGEIGVDGNNPVVTPWFYENSRAYRNNPTVKNANTTWTALEWIVDTDGATTTDMTPGYGDNDYIYDNGTWNNNIYLSSSPDGVNQPNRNMFIKSGEVTLTNDTSIGDLVVRSGATLRIQALLEVTGDIVNEGTIIFESTAAQTAVLGEVASNTRVVGDGFEMHRYFTAKRSFRYVSSSVNSTANINANWQEGATSAAHDPNPGFGTHITGSQTGDNGFDATETGNPSMFTWDNINQAWVPIQNTNATDLILGQAYGLMVRGDRTTDLTMNNAPASATTLRSTGSIHIGDFPVTNLPENSTVAIPKYALVGNPYPAQVDMQTLLSNNASGFNPNHMWVYDPNIGTLGGYATVDLSDGSNDITTPDFSEANQFLQPNQAVFLQTTATSPSLTFVESAKASGAATLQTFSEDTPITDHSLRINLIRSDQNILVDGVKLKMASTYADEVNQNDAVKFWNTTEQLAIKSDSNYLSIEKRSFPSNSDTLALYLGNYQAQDYQLEFKNNLPSHVEAVLYDQYLDQMHPISSGLSQYAYPIDVVLPGSVDSDRFFIIFGNENLEMVNYPEFSKMEIYPNPVSNGKLHLKLPSEIKIGTSVEISIFDARGNRIMQKELNTTEQTLSFQLGNLSAGVYLLRAIQGNRQYTQKLIVE